MKLFSRALVAGAAALLAAQVCGQANPATDFPNRQVRIIVPYPAGGTADVLPRIVAQKLSEKWGQPVVVENRAGAAGNIGAEVVAKAPGDGYTLLATPPAPLVINQSLYRRLPFEPERFVPVTTLAAVPNVLAVRRDLPANSVRQFVDLARKSGGKINVATQGNGTTSHLTAALFASQSGVSFTFIPYKGTAPALTDLMGGQVDAFFDNLSSMHQLHEAGKARILAVTGKRRSPLMPNMPTVAEAGLPGFDASTWFGVVAPPGTPAVLAEKISAAIAEALALPDVQQKLRDQGAESVGDPPEHMKEFMASERKRWKAVIDAAKVSAD